MKIEDRQIIRTATGLIKEVQKFVKLLRNGAAELGLKSEVRANSSGCLDACEFGITLVVYPEQIWYGGVKIDDVDEIIQSHLIKNIPVKRLMVNHPSYNKDAKS